MVGIKSILLGFLTMLCLVSCGVIKYNISEGSEFVPKGNEFFSGSYELDITPLPAHPMGGFGNDIGQISRGVWSRLYASACYLKDTTGNYMILVSTDLWSIPEGLRDNILQKLQSESEPFDIRPERLLLTATHTHYSQGNYSSSFGYNQGSAALPGFDKSMFEFLSDRIVYAIKKAIVSAEPSYVEYTQFDLPGLTRNRSIEAFLANPEEIKAAFYSRISNPEQFTTEMNSCFIKNDPRAFQAVNPQITNIIVKAKNTDRITTLISSVAAHPTVMGSASNLYSADVFGVARSILRNAINSEGGSPVIISMQAESGDVSFNWETQNFEECKRLGSMLASSIIKNLKSSKALVPKLNCVLQSNYIADVPLNNDIYNEVQCSSSNGARTAPKPIVGRSVLSGAEDGRVTKHIKDEFIDENGVDECLFLEGKPNEECYGNHGKKKPHVLAILAQKSAPNYIPVGIFSIGNLDMILLPGEITSALGFRIKSDSYDLKSTSPQPIIVGLSNEYLSYFSTPSEYNEQHYEGGFTVYGEASGLYLAHEVKRLKKFEEQKFFDHGVKKYHTGPFKLKDKKIQKKIDGEWQGGLESLSLFLDGNNTEIYSEDWEIGVDLFNSSSSLRSQLPSIKVQEQVSAGIWRDLVITENVGENSLEFIQDDGRSVNFINYVKERNNRYYWSSIWIVDKNYQNENDLQMVFTLSNGNRVISKPFKLKI